MLQEEDKLWQWRKKDKHQKSMSFLPLEGKQVKVDKIYITMGAHQKLMYYVEEAEEGNTEISGFGRVKTVRHGVENVLLIDDVTILDQEGSSGFTEIDHKVISKFMVDLNKQKDSIEYWKVWWHTHTHTTFWSETDKETINEKFAKTFIVSLEISNKDKTMIARVDVFSPFRHTIEVKTIEILYEEDEILREKIKKEVKEKVKKSSLIEHKLNTNTIYPYMGFTRPINNHSLSCKCKDCKREEGKTL